MKRQFDDISNTEPIEEISIVHVDGEKFELNSGQVDAFNKTLTKIYNVENESFYVFISGAAGTGKTLLLKALRDKTQEKFGRDSCLVTAPISTGAEPLWARTIHSNFLLSRGEELEALSNEQLFHLKKHLENRKVLFIDIINYVSAATFAKMDERLKEVFGNNLPFGGLSVIVFGDLLQLQPIGPAIFGDVDLKLQAGRDQKFTDSAKTLWSLMETLELATNERLDKDRFSGDSEVLEILRTTGDARFVHSYLADFCRFGPDSKTGLKEIICEYEQLKKSNPNKKFTILVPTNSMVESIHDEILGNLGQVHEFYSIDHATSINNPGEDYILEGRESDQYLKVAIGSQVMLTCNLPNQTLLHGMFGIVTGFEKDIIVVEFPSGSAYIHRSDWYSKAEDNLYEVWKQFPIRSAEAFTIDMSQGMTLDGIILVAKNRWTTSFFETLDPGHIYVALSRARSLPLCRITPFTHFGWQRSEGAMSELKRMRNGEGMKDEEPNFVHRPMSHIYHQDDQEVSGGYWSTSWSEAAN